MTDFTTANRANQAITQVWIRADSVNSRFVLPLKSLNEADVLPSDLNNNYFAETHYAMRFRDGTEVAEHDGTFTTYVLFGPTRRVESRDVVTVFDPQLPAWILGSLGALLALAAFLTARPARR